MAKFLRLTSRNKASFSFAPARVLFYSAAMLKKLFAPRYPNRCVPYVHNTPSKTGVLLVNLGTPDATDYFSMRRYLKQFLSDPRIVESPPRPVWWFILNAIVLTTRPTKSGANYKKVWDKEQNAGPLLVYTRSQTDKLRAKLTAMHPNLHVDFAMRYGNPSIESKLHLMQEQGCDKILVFPLYPQYAAATTGSVCDDVFDALKKMRWMPTLRVAAPYHDHPAYIDALAQSISDTQQQLNWQPDLIVASYHGVPQESLYRGDPYHCHCHKTTRLLREALNMLPNQLTTTFQSRFGPAEWLQPYTDETLEALPARGVKNVWVITPGFASDCLETLEEIAMEGKEIFMEHGGENYHTLPCLNDSPASINMLHTIVCEELQGWLAVTQTKARQKAA